MRISSILMIAGTLALASCNGTRDDEARENAAASPSNDGSDGAPVNRSEEPKNVAAPQNHMEDPTISDEQQIQDDAEASGMTSKLADENGATSDPDSSVANNPTAISSPSNISEQK